jgi:GAF domain-containing protein
MTAGGSAARGPDELMEAVAEIARRLAESDDLDELLQRVVTLGEDYLDGCEGVSLMLIRKGGVITSPAFSSQVAYDSDMVQYATNEGPCLEAIRDQHTVLIDDLASDERWPRYREQAMALGVRSMVSFRLFLLGDTMGALDFYSSRPHAFDERSRLVGQVFASHAAVALKAAIAEAGSEAALRTRDVIGQAKGVLMAREGITAYVAFDRLRELSQQLNRPVRELAEEVAATGEVPARRAEG